MQHLSLHTHKGAIFKPWLRKLSPMKQNPNPQITKLKQMKEINLPLGELKSTLGSPPFPSEILTPGAKVFCPKLA